jgi:hypothetical protein
MREKNEALIRGALKDGCRAHCDELIDELRRQHEEITQHRHAAAATNRCIADLVAQRDALLEKINGVLAAQRSEGGGCGGFINKPPTREHQRRVAQAWQELHEVINAVEGEKT